SNGLLGTFAGSCVCLAALTADGKTLAVTETAVGTDLDKTLDVECYIAAKIAYDCVGTLDCLTKRCDLLLCEVTHSKIRIYTCLFKYIVGKLSSDYVDISKSDFTSFFTRNIYTCYTSHSTSGTSCFYLI